MKYDKLSRIVIIFRRIIISFFILYLFLRPLSLPNWFITDDFVHEIDSSWQSFKCGLRFDQQFAQLSDVFTNATGGGYYQNNNCPFAQQVAIIVPFRNRTAHLKAFLKYIHHFLLSQNAIHYQIFVVEQNDNLPFNRGALFNVGFKEVLRQKPLTYCFIFHDVDILPADFRQHYTCSNHPKHLCSYLDKMRYVLMYKEFFGVVVAMNRYRFEEINGFSNLYSGWGGEDDDLYTRVRSKNAFFERYDSQIGKCHMMRHTHNSVEANNRYDLLNKTLERIQFDGLSNIEQFYKNLHIENYRLFTKISVEFIQR